MKVGKQREGSLELTWGGGGGGWGGGKEVIHFLKFFYYTFEALVSRHPRDAKEVSVTQS